MGSQYDLRPTLSGQDRWKLFNFRAFQQTTRGATEGPEIFVLGCGDVEA
jgi:hypothetical protein